MADLDLDSIELHARFLNLGVVLDLVAEVRSLRDAIAAISRYGHSDCLPANEDTYHKPGYCYGCNEPWPCPTEQAHRMQEEDRG